ncbi:hypothetical protein HY933_03675 [Candidatus Falkowbacteria bacterium]|nr:hypothetical protein [Candidatus Falkowbacteria bacterium]
MPYCRNCSQAFDITLKEKDFYAKMGTKQPSHCFDCRMQRKYAFRNERKIYNRQCSLCQQQIISSYPADAPFPVYCFDCWWSDRWDGLSYGRDFDWSRPFFSQLSELSLKVPHQALPNPNNNQNSPYVTWADWNKNCYLVFSSSMCEDCLYSEVLVDARDCVDCTNVKESENCYFSIDLQKCYNVKFSRNVKDCLDCNFCFDCADCKNCFLSYNLRHGEYYIRNVQYSPDAYVQAVERIMASRSELVRAWDEFINMMRSDAIHQFARQVKCEDVEGDELYACKRSFNSFDSREIQDCCNIIYGDKINDCADSFAIVDHAEKCLEVFSVNGGYQNMYGYGYWGKSQNSRYSNTCVSSVDCFGCIGLKHQKYCILNKQYLAAEYQIMVKKVLEHMRKSNYPTYAGQTSEWGEFFPVQLSPFAYNETMAHVYYPLKKEEVLARGWGWRDENDILTGKETIHGEALPDAAASVPKGMTDQVIGCADCGRNYKLIKQEIDFYTKHTLPLPKMCPECRFQQRLALRNPRKLWPRQCTCLLGHASHQGQSVCPIHFKTTYRPAEGGEAKVYCEECYQKEIY